MQLAFAPILPVLPPRQSLSISPRRPSSRCRPRTTACLPTPSDLPSPADPSTASSAPCTYCQNDKEVVCPVCEGRGYHGRTIVCYYCRGAQRIECPLCADDVYKFSYVKHTNDPEAPASDDQS